VRGFWYAGWSGRVGRRRGAVMTKTLIFLLIVFMTTIVPFALIIAGASMLSWYWKNGRSRQH
jgi:hypothetical protein